MTIGPDACANRSLVMVRLAVPASAPPASAVSRKLRRDTFLCFMTSLLSDPLLGQSDIEMHDLRLRLEIVRLTAVDDGTLLHQEHARAQFQRGLDVLLDEEDGNAGLVDAVNLAPDLRDEARHDALGRLVEDDQLRPHHQAAGNGE